jgi:hypothetical protein
MAKKKSNQLAVFFFLYFNLIIIFNFNNLILSNDHFNYLVSFYKKTNSFLEYYDFKQNYLNECNYENCIILFRNTDVDYYLNYGFFVISTYFVDIFNNNVNSVNISAKIILGQFFLYSSLAFVLGKILNNNKFFLIFIFSIFYFFAYYKYKLFYVLFHFTFLVTLFFILFQDKVNLRKFLIYSFFSIVILFLSWTFIKITSLNIFRSTGVFYLFFLSSLLLNENKRNFAEFFLILLCTLSHLYLSSIFILINIILSFLNKNNLKYVTLKIIYFLIVQFYIFVNFQNYNFDIISFYKINNLIVDNFYLIFLIIFFISFFSYFLFYVKFITLKRDNLLHYIILYLGSIYLILIKSLENIYITNELIFFTSINDYFVKPSVALFLILLVQKKFFNNMEINMNNNLKNINNKILSLPLFIILLLIFLYGLFIHNISISLHVFNKKFNYYMKNELSYKTYIYEDLSLQWYLLNAKKKN